MKNNESPNLETDKASDEPTREDFFIGGAAVKPSDEAKFFLAAIVESSNDSIVTIDLDGAITSWNRAAERLYGYSSREAIGKPLMMIALPEDLAEVFGRIEEIKQGRKVEIYDTVRVHKDGRHLHLEIVISPVKDDKKRIIGVSTIARDLTEHRKAEDAVRESEEKYRHVFNSIDEGFCIIEMIFDADNKPLDYLFLEANPMFESLTGLTNAVGKTARQMVPNLEAFWFEIFGRIALTGEPERFENYSAPMNRQFDVHASRVGSETSRKVIIVFTNITTRKRTETNLAFLAEISQDLVKLTNIGETMNALGAKVGGHFNASRCAFFEFNEELDGAVCEYDWHRADAASLVGSYRISDFYTDEFLRDLRAGKAFVVSDRDADSRVNAENLHALNIASYIVIPISRNKQLRFVLCIYDSAARDWLGDEIELMREITARIWTRLERARAEEVMRVAEERYFALFNSIEQGFCTLEVAFDAKNKPTDYRFLEVSPSFERQTGISNAAGRWMREIAPAHDEHWFDIYGRIALTGEPERFENYSTPLNRWWSVYAFRIHNPALRRVGVLFFDITDRKRVEEALRESEARYRLFVNAISDILYKMSADWSEMRFLDGKSFLTDTDTDNPSISWLETYIPDTEKPLVQSAITEAIRTKNTFELEHRVIRADGTIGWTFSRAIPFFDERGEIVEWFGAASDITEKKHAEEALRVSEERLRTLIENLPGSAVFVLDKDLRYLVADGEALAEAGLAPADFIGKTIFEALSPETAIDYEPRFRAGLAGEAFEHEHEAHDRTFVSRGVPLRSANGEIYAVLAISYDISRRKRAEEALRESEERYGLATQAVKAVIYDWNITGDVIIRSPELEKLIGFLPDETEINTNAWWKSRVHPEDAKRAIGLVREKINSNATRFEDEYRIRHRAGHYVWVSDIGVFLRDENGRAVRCVGSVTNVTKRREAEEKLQESEKLMRSTLDSLVPSIAIIDRDGVILDVNEAWTEFAENNECTDPHGDIGVNYLDVLRRAAISGEPDAKLILEGIEAVLAKTTPEFEFEYPCHSPREERWFLMNVSSLTTAQGGAVFSHTDITERKLAEETLRQSEERLRLLIESADDYAIFTMTQNGIIDSWNAGAEKTFGWTETEAVGQSCKIIFTPEDRKEGAPELEMTTALKNGRAPDERFHLRKDGTRFYVSGVMTLLKDANGKASGLVKIARDMTERIEAEKAIYDKEMLQKLVGAQEDERRRIARDLHDELGQQLTALRLNLEKARRICDDENVCAEIDKIELLAKSVDNGVDFLAWELRPAALDQLGLVAALANYVDQWTHYSGVSAEFLASSLKRKRFAREVETNLYRIAQEAMNNINKHAKAKSVEVMLEKRGELIVLIIQDDGVGFNVKTKKTRSKGIGLIGMQERAELINGTLEIESAVGAGTTIFVRVPASSAKKGDSNGK